MQTNMRNVRFSSSNQQETVMDAQKFELDALSDDQLDAVSGGDVSLGDVKTQANQNALNQQQTDMENKQAAAACKGFQQLLQEM
jgi:hypothetical protein